MGASTALAARSGWSIWPGMPGQFAPEWGGQFDAESLVTFRRNQVVCLVLNLLVVFEW
jgi:hypothetical protein